MRTIPSVNPKAEPIRVSEDATTYANDAFTLQFQQGAVPRYGVRNGVFEEEVIAALIDRADRTGHSELADKLQEAFDILVPPAEPAATDAAHAATDAT